MTKESRIRRKSNRVLLREWKMDNVPGFRQRIEAGASVNHETGRSKFFKKYADRHLLVLVGGDQHDPLFQWMHYDEIAKRNRNNDWVSRTMLRRFWRDPHLEQRCWYTGVLLYLVPWREVERLDWRVPWMCSREHLVCGRNGGTGHGDSNIVIASYHFNKKLGHSPLPLKLLIRQELVEIPYDRNRPTWDATGAVLDAMIGVEDQFRLGKHYPWQPWAFEPGTREHRIADGFHQEMLEAEREFLSLDDDGRAEWIDNFVWRW